MGRRPPDVLQQASPAPPPMRPRREPVPAPPPAAPRGLVSLAALAVGEEFDLPCSGRHGRKLRESTPSSTLVRLWPPPDAPSAQPTEPPRAPEDLYIGTSTVVQPRPHAAA